MQAGNEQRQEKRAEIAKGKTERGIGEWTKKKRILHDICIRGEVLAILEVGFREKRYRVSAVDHNKEKQEKHTWHSSP